MDDSEDYLSEVLYYDWCEVFRPDMRKEKILKIYGNLGESFREDKVHNT